MPIQVYGVAAFARRAFVLLALLAAAMASIAPAAAQGDIAFRRGVSIHDAMNWATMDAAKKHYVYPPFSDATHPLTADELTVIKNAGFDFIRLTIDPGPFLQFQGAQLDGTYDILRARVQMILAAGFSVIVDFHPVKQDLDYGPEAIVKGIDTPLFNAYCAMLTRTAGVLEGLRNGHVALELINEPELGGTPGSDAQWQAMEETLYHSARKGGRTLTVVLQGDQTGEYQGLLALNPTPFAADPHAIFTFHYYLPYIFTNQSLPSGSLRIAADIPYPARARGIEDSTAALAARMSKWNESDLQKMSDASHALVNLTRYRASNFDRSSIKTYFDPFSQWAARYGIAPSRILLGEFGVIRRYGRYDGARDSERALWLHDVRQLAEEHGFGWSVWAYRGYGGMAIVRDDSTDQIDEVTLKALGLR
jgi:hypothetical protein